MTAALHFSADVSEGTFRRIMTMADRVLAMDSGGMARIRPLEGAVDFFFSTPLGSTFAQRLPNAWLSDGGAPAAPITEDTAVVSLVTLRDVLASDAVKKHISNGVFHPTDEAFSLGARSDLMWRGALPPLTGYQLFDFIPGSVIRETYDDMAYEQETSGGPAGIARSLLEQDLIEITAESDPAQRVNINGHMMAVIGATSMAPDLAAHPNASAKDVVRVSATGSWIRIDGIAGSLYTPRPGGLARVP